MRARPHLHQSQHLSPETPVRLEILGDGKEMAGRRSSFGHWEMGKSARSEAGRRWRQGGTAEFVGVLESEDSIGALVLDILLFVVDKE